MAAKLPAQIQLVPVSERQRSTHREGKNKEETRRGYVNPGDWMIPADLDEFIQFPASISQIIEEMNAAGATFIMGSFSDRMSSDGSLTGTTPTPSLWEQYPLAGPVSEMLVQGWCHKVTLCRGDCELTDQTLAIRQIIVVDDGSTDQGAILAESYSSVTLIRKPHSGIRETLNQGLDKATGDYLAFLDADDRWLPEKTRLQMEAFQADPQFEAVFGHSRRFRSIDRGEGRTEIPLDVVPGLSKTCLLIRRSSFDRTGRFPETTSHDFLGWYLNSRQVGLRTKMLPDIVAERRIHGANFGIVHRAAQRHAYHAALKADLDRRRRASGFACPET